VTVATIMVMYWREATSDQYDQVREKAQWDRDLPDGAKLHVCGFNNDGMHILDVWESEESFNAYFQQRIDPAVQAVGNQLLRHKLALTPPVSRRPGGSRDRRSVQSSVPIGQDS
jgi:hypothetical protein